LSSVPLEAIEFAIDQLNAFLDFRENNDIDVVDQTSIVNCDEKWSKYYEWFYAACQ
jgi:hypothetical protein